MSAPSEAPSGAPAGGAGAPAAAAAPPTSGVPAVTLGGVKRSAMDAHIDDAYGSEGDDTDGRTPAPWAKQLKGGGAALAASALATAVVPPAVGAAAGLSPVRSPAEWRRLQLAQFLVKGAESPPKEVAERVLRNMALTGEAFAARFGPALAGVLTRPLPYDNADPRMRSIMRELMPSAGDGAILARVWGALSTAFASSAQVTPFVGVVGVSGVGKTKVAYDIGMQHAFVVMSRIVERDTLSLPWSVFHDFAHQLVRTAPGAGGGAGAALPPLQERLSLKAALVVLLAAHLEWAVRVSEAAVVCEAFTATVVASQTDGATMEDARERVLREVVLRVQRNGLAYSNVAAIFVRTLRDMLDAPGAVTDDGGVALSGKQAADYLRSVVDRARAVWGRQAPGETTRDELCIVWAHDEAHALLDPRGLPPNIFDGTWERREPERHEPVALPCKVPRGYLYGLLAAVRDVLRVVYSGHLLIGASLDLTDEVVAGYSPAQGMAEVVPVRTHLTGRDIRAWLERYLTPAALAGADQAVLDQLGGRPLFAAQFWVKLAASCITRPVTPPAGLVREVLTTTLCAATDAAVQRMLPLWNRHTPAAGGQVPGKLLHSLFHDMVMAGGPPLTDAHMHAEVRECLHRGILNVAAESDAVTAVTLEPEPATAAALRQVGERSLHDGRDPVMELLASRVVGPRGGVADLGSAQEECFAWKLVSTCLARNGEVSLADLLRPYLARADCTVTPDGHVHASLLPDDLDDWVVRLRCGRRCDGKEWRGRSPLAGLVANPHALMHHPRDEMAGPDVMFLAFHCVTGASRLVVMQLKNRATGTLSEALLSLDLGRCHPDTRGVETPGHADMRAVLAAHPGWQRPIRIVVGARPVAVGVLLATAWLNALPLAPSPVLLLHLSRANLGVDIAAPGATDAEYGRPRTWECLWPSPLRHWPPAPAAQPLPALPPAPTDFCAPSLAVQFSADASTTEADLERVAEVMGGGSVTVTHHRLAPESVTRSCTVRYESAVTAFAAVERSQHSALTAGAAAARVVARFV